MRPSLSNRGWGLAAAVLLGAGGYFAAHTDTTSARLTPRPSIEEPSVSDLVAKLRSAEVLDRRRASDALARRGPAAAEALRPLLNALGDSDVLVRLQVAIAVGRIGAPAVESLLDALDGPDSYRRQAAADALGYVKPAPEAAVRRLTVALGSDDDTLAANAARSLTRFGAMSVEALIGRLQVGPSAARARAAKALAGMESPPESAVVPLVAALADDEEAVRLTAAEALPAFGAVAAGPLSAALAEPHAEVRRLAAEALAGLPRFATVAVGPLAAAVADPDRQVRRAAAAALGMIDPPSPAVVPPLQRALQDTDPAVRRTAAEALGRMGREARGAVTSLLDLQADDAPPVREAATRALVRIVLDGPAAQAHRVTPGLSFASSAG
jgi:HEAT repeat protein